MSIQLLISYTEFADTSRRKKGKSDSSNVPEKPRFHVRMPPELLIQIDMPMAVLKSFYLLPSLMHRMESLMLASQLREEIACQSNNFYISSSLVCQIYWFKHFSILAISLFLNRMAVCSYISSNF